jgi:cobalt-zinc-cadmium efflux system outer membrane protein
VNSIPVPLGRTILLAVALALAGCANLPDDRGLSDVRELLTARDAALGTQSKSLHSGAAPELERQVETLLHEPLTPERAVGVALLRHPDVRLQYARLGLAQADWLEASRLSNPVLSLSVLESNAPGEGSRLGFGLVQNFGDLLFLRQRGHAADAQLAHERAAVAAALQRLAADVTARYYDWVGAAQLAQMRALLATAAEASAELARRFHAAGNLDALGLAREEAAAQQAHLDAEAANAASEAARIALNAAMGLAPFELWSAEPKLALPVTDETALPELVALGQRQRLDLQATQREIEALQSAAALAQRLRWLPFVEVGVEGERETDGTRLFGPTLSLSLPLFGQSRSGALRAQALLERSQAQRAMLSSAAANDIAAAYARLLAARARSERYRVGLIPQREAIVARTQELQNYMIVGQFELLLAKQQEYAAYEGYLEALRDYWLARVDLSRAVGGALPSDARIGNADVGSIVLPAAADTSDAHSQHHPHHDGMTMPGAPEAQPMAADPHAHHRGPDASAHDPHGAH